MAGVGYSGNYNGTTEDNTTPAVESIEFLKKDGTQVPYDYDDKNNSYTNALTDEELTVNITYNKQVSMDDTTWTINGSKITKKFDKSGTETVTVKNSYGSSSITLNVKIDTEYPVIKIDGAEVEADKIKITDETKQREQVEGIPYTGVIGKYTKAVQIEVTDDGIDADKINEKVKIYGTDQEFKNNMVLSKLGKYRIEVKDDANNEVIYEFVITTDRNNIKINEKSTEKLEKGDKEVNLIRMSTNKKAIILSDPNTTRQTFERELKLEVDTELSKENIEKDISIINNGKKTESKNENGTDEVVNTERIKTGMKIKILDVEYDLVVEGDIDGDGLIEQRDINIANYLLALNKKENNEGILIDEDWSFDLNELLDEDYGVKVGDYNGDGKIDEEDIEELMSKLDVNEDGEFDEKDQELIKYALDLNDDGIFNKEDINIMIEDSGISFDKEDTTEEQQNEQETEEKQEETEEEQYNEDDYDETEETEEAEDDEE